MWSAGCATGQEPYTLAAVLADYFEDDPDWHIEIVGTDIDAEGIQTARAGCYPISLKKEIPARYMMRYFDTNGDVIEVSDALRSRVEFREQNLRKLNKWARRFDLIFCRNVIMYFEKDFRAELAEHFHSSLHDDGYMFLGSSESLHSMPRVFKSHKVGKTLVFRLPPRAAHPLRADRLDTVAVGRRRQPRQTWRMGALLQRRSRRELG